MHAVYIPGEFHSGTITHLRREVDHGPRPGTDQASEAVRGYYSVMSVTQANVRTSSSPAPTAVVVAPPRTPSPPSRSTLPRALIACRRSSLCSSSRRTAKSRRCHSVAAGRVLGHDERAPPSVTIVIACFEVAHQEPRRPHTRRLDSNPPAKQRVLERTGNSAPSLLLNEEKNISVHPHVLFAGYPQTQALFKTMLPPRGPS